MPTTEHITSRSKIHENRDRIRTEDLPEADLDIPDYAAAVTLP
jgi:hypothetical protein